MPAPKVRILDAITDVPREAWDALLDPAATPFVKWAWLEALEKSGCATTRKGWTPRHLALFRGDQLIAAAPAYSRADSDGDFARDWELPSVAARAGVSYFPKLSITVPFTPAGGRRFLVAPGEARGPAIAALLEGARALCVEEGISTIQVLFPDAEEMTELEAAGLARRVSFQYHWQNAGYRDMDQFLGRMNSKRRTASRREMGAAATQGILLRTVRGEEIAKDHALWAKHVHALHSSTVEKLMWGRRWLNRAFYDRIFETMPEHLEVVAATKDGRLVAGAFNVSSGTHLFGRYWGCFEDHPFLHFNVCLYHSIADCIARGLQVFEGGAGGEHKISRGFEPAETFSGWSFLDQRFDRAMRSYLRDETEARHDALLKFREESPVLKPRSTDGEAKP